MTRSLAPTLALWLATAGVVAGGALAFLDRARPDLSSEGTAAPHVARASSTETARAVPRAVSARGAPELTAQTLTTITRPTTLPAGTGHEPALALPVVGIEEVPSSSSLLLAQQQIAVDDDDEIDHRIEGEDLLLAGDARGAVVALRKALATQPMADVWALLGDAHLQSGDDEPGLACLEEAVSRDVDQLRARRLLARAYLARNDGAHARLHAEEWARLAPQDVGARQALGRALGQLRLWREAIEQYAIVVDVEPANAWAHNNLGHAALQLGDDALALAHLELAARVGGQPVMLNNLGVVFERIGRTAEAHAAFERALELSPTYAVAAVNRARVQRLLDHGARLAAAEALLALRTPSPPLSSSSQSSSSSSSSSSSEGSGTAGGGTAHAE